MNITPNAPCAPENCGHHAEAEEPQPSYFTVPAKKRSVAALRWREKWAHREFAAAAMRKEGYVTKWQACARSTAGFAAVEFISYEATLKKFQQEWLEIVKGKRGKRS